MKRTDYISWDEYFMGIAMLAARRSKDPSTQVGACIVSQDNIIISTGYNGMPKGCSDDEFPWDREGEDTKYPYVVHAELNAILNANGRDLRGSKLYVALFPCNECAKAIIQSGVKEVLYLSDKYADSMSTLASKRMLMSAGVKFTQLRTQLKEVNAYSLMCIRPVLDRIEHHGATAAVNTDDLNIEHIMPQTLSDDWKTALGEDWERIHQQYLHTMANLTLTGYNSQYSNLTFVQKRDMEKGFKESAYRLNTYVRSCEQWTENELLQRQSDLFEVVLSLWPMPTTTFQPVKAEAESASLDEEDYEFTGKKLQAYTFNGMRVPVLTWKEMLIQVCGHILIEKRSTLEWLCANESHGFSHTAESWRKELAPNMYVWTDNSTSTKINILRGMLNECNIPLSELIFEFRADVVEGDED